MLKLLEGIDEINDDEFELLELQIIRAILQQTEFQVELEVVEVRLEVVFRELEELLREALYTMSDLY
jgi:hypothetical protein